MLLVAMGVSIPSARRKHPNHRTRTPAAAFTAFTQPYRLSIFHSVVLPRKGIIRLIQDGRSVVMLTFFCASVLVRLAMWQPEDDPIGNKPILYCFDWLRAYFEHPDKVDQAVTPDLCPASFSTHGNFTEKVWLTLRSEVPFGTTISYAQLASLSGSPRAARAVGNAMGRNPLPLVVPCHRVIKSGGQPGAYCWGKRDNVKKWLLAHEKEAFGAIVNNTSIINY